ncbi:MAG: cupin domain-containing protein [Planctomycetota bacterium]|nr:cupin domain-containing protein [Planctomycetota bacterium]MDA1180397.1 cupin domain-containing protein [Planctomycetota bacterium]
MRVIRASEQSFVAAAHEDPRNPGVLKRVLAKRDELLDGRVQMVNWARLPARSSFRAHYHEDMEEIFVVLNGPVEMVVDDTKCALLPGDAIVIAPREVHTMTNNGDADVDYVVIGIAGGLNGKTVVV